MADLATDTTIDPEDLVSRAGDMSSLPASAQRVIEVASDPDSDAGDLQEIISHDLTLTAKLLKLVNSAYYGFSDSIADIRRAVVILGFNAVRSLALSVSVCEMFRSEDKIGSYSRRGLWEHSVAVGVAAKMICRRFSTAPPEEGFVAGLVHDVGMVLEDQYVHSAFEKAVLLAEEKRVALWTVERDIFGTDHAELGRRLAEHWRFPERVATAVGLHHQPSTRGQPAGLAGVLHVADVIAYAKRVGFATAVTATPDMDAFRALGLSRKDVVVIFEDLDEDLGKARAFFEI